MPALRHLATEAISVRLVAIVALDAEVLAERHQLSLDATQVADDARILPVGDATGRR